MCGIAGFVDRSSSAEEAGRLLRSMTDAISYRGPDAEGAWFDESFRVGLGHRRLSIVDLSVAGAQPMHSMSGRFVLTFNGEIYNHLAIRRELLKTQSGLVFRGHSDTEVMLAAFEQWGLPATLARLNGMFAFALLDRSKGQLHLVRDRLGEKPLYYAKFGEVLVFASELKAMTRHWAWNASIDRKALSNYLHYGYVPGPASIYSGVYKVVPGGWVEVTLTGREAPVLRSTTYWSASAAVTQGLANPLTLSDGEAIEQLDVLLADAVGLRMVADVPLGAFLSGGIDSSTVVGLMQRQSSRPVRTFAIGFGEKRFNEAESARAVAQHLKTDHTELYVTPQQALEVIPQLPQMYDEPFADASQIPTFLVAKLARQHVTVSLSGDGGDELFCGYHRYPVALQLWRSLRRAPRWLRGVAAAGVRSIPLPLWDVLGAPLPERVSAGRTGDRMYKLADRFDLGSFDAVYDSLLAQWQNPEQALTSSHLAQRDHAKLRRDTGEYDQMMAFDLETYLPDDILVKLDRASMAVSLESRVPLLDHRVVEFAWRLPLHMKRRGGTYKWLLRQVLYRLVPQGLVDRPKQGFGVPIEYWLRSELRDWACDLLNANRLKQDGFLDPIAVPRMLNEHLSGRRAWTSQLWTAIMFQAWLARA